jgi:hypothetical protein
MRAGAQIADAKSPRQRRGMKQDAARSWKLHFCKLLVDFVLWCPTVTDRWRLLPEAKKGPGERQS